MRADSGRIVGNAELIRGPVSTSVTVQKALWEVTKDGSEWMVGNSEVIVRPDLPAPLLAVQLTDSSA